MPDLRAVAVDAADPGRSTRCSTTWPATPLDGPAGLASQYVETFDLRRKACLYLTYYAYGDTRERGMALLAFKRAFRAAGPARSAPTSCPTTCAWCSSSARRPTSRPAPRLLLEHRAGLELLRLALVDAGSPWAGALTAVVLDAAPAARRRARGGRRGWPPQGPPGESVGLEPYAAPDALRREAADERANPALGRRAVPVPGVLRLGHVWRYRYDKFGWTTRSSQLYESRLLRWGSPLFHFGILAVFLGHVMGLGIPESWTDRDRDLRRARTTSWRSRIGVDRGVLHPGRAWRC